MGKNRPDSSASLGWEQDTFSLSPLIFTCFSIPLVTNHIGIQICHLIKMWFPRQQQGIEGFELRSPGSRKLPALTRLVSTLDTTHSALRFLEVILDFQKTHVSGCLISFFSLFFALRGAVLWWGWSRQEPPALGSRNRGVMPAAVTGTAIPAGPDGDHQFCSRRRWVLAARAHCSVLAGTI